MLFTLKKIQQIKTCQGFLAPEAQWDECHRTKGLAGCAGGGEESFVLGNALLSKGESLLWDRMVSLGLSGPHARKLLVPSCHPSPTPHLTCCTNPVLGQGAEDLKTVSMCME